MGSEYAAMRWQERRRQQSLLILQSSLPVGVRRHNILHRNDQCMAGRKVERQRGGRCSFNVCR